jgi:hypothetical protein
MTARGKSTTATTPEGMPLEHDFNVTADQWEAAVFRNATSFRLHRYWRGGRSEAEVATFPEAVTTATMALDDPAAPGARVIVYAVADTGRFIAIPPQRWQHYLEVWEKVHGQAGAPTGEARSNTEES